jgi:hypothetical protein
MLARAVREEPERSLRQAGVRRTARHVREGVGTCSLLGSLVAKPGDSGSPLLRNPHSCLARSSSSGLDCRVQGPASGLRSTSAPGGAKPPVSESPLQSDSRRVTTRRRAGRRSESNVSLSPHRCLQSARGWRIHSKCGEEAGGPGDGPTRHVPASLRRTLPGSPEPSGALAAALIGAGGPGSRRRGV